MQTDDAQQTHILEQMKPEVSPTFWCQNCQCERKAIEKRRTVVVKAGRSTGVTRCVWCIGKAKKKPT